MILAHILMKKQHILLQHRTNKTHISIQIFFFMNSKISFKLMNSDHNDKNINSTPPFIFTWFELKVHRTHPWQKSQILVNIFKFENRYHNPNLLHYKLRIKYESIIHAHNDKNIKFAPLYILHHSSSKFTGSAID